MLRLLLLCRSALMVGCVLPGCVTPSQVIVHVTADDASAERAEFLRLEVFASDGSTTPSYIQSAEFGESLARLNAEPALLTVVPRNSDASRMFRITATLSDGSRREFVQRSAISAFVPGEIMEIWLHIDDACTDVTCAGRQTCDVVDEGMPACVDACVVPSSPGSVVRSELQACGESCAFVEEGGLCDGGTGRCWRDECCHTCFDGERCVDEAEATTNLAATGVGGAECVQCECEGDSINPAGGCGGTQTAGLALGAEHACINFNGRLHCWGNNDAGQIGNGEVGGVVEEPQFIADGLSAAALGRDHSCAHNSTNNPTCWGEGTRFQLGHGSSENVSAPRLAIVTEGPFRIMSAGQRHTCGATADGVYCWGSASDGQTGVPGLNEDSGSIRVPTLVLDGEATSLETTLRTTCAIAAGRLYCWGYNDSGGVGVSSEMRRIYAPVETGVDKAGEWVDVTVSGFGVCALDVEHHLFCRGQVRTDVTLDFGGELPSEEHLIFQIGEQRWRSIELGEHFLCGILEDDDSLVCLGQNDQGQLGGEGSARVEHGPVGVRWQRLETGDDFACAVRQDDTLWCWGNNAFGQLGTRDISDMHSSEPEPPRESIFALEPRRVCPPE